MRVQKLHNLIPVRHYSSAFRWTLEQGTPQAAPKCTARLLDWSWKPCGFALWACMHGIHHCGVTEATSACEAFQQVCHIQDNNGITDSAGSQQRLQHCMWSCRTAHSVWKSVVGELGGRDQSGAVTQMHDCRRRSQSASIAGQGR
jgi:hypothetical protein